MDGMADTRLWAERTFGAANMGDQRRTRRLVHSAAQIAAHPQKSFPQVFELLDLRAFYRLCAQEAATLAAIQQPHWEQTRQAMRQQPLVLTIHDTTVLDYTAHPQLRGVGPIGDGDGRGLLQHNSLAVLPQPRQVLGLAYQQLHVRQPAPPGERSYQRKQRPRESAWWLEGIRAAGEAPPECCWIDVGDRGSDIYEAMVAAREVRHHFLFRLTQNRHVFLSADGDAACYLKDYARSLPSQADDVVAIPGRGGRPARTATVQLAAAPVWIPAPRKTPGRSQQPRIAAWVIRIWEPDPPADVAEPLEWLLLCSLPTRTPDELKQRRDWYCCRWLVEVYHDIEKNGCSEEERRFETAARMEACLAVLAVVAVRVLQLRCALDAQPEAPAAQVATALEVRLIRQSSKAKGRRFTVRDFVRGVAQLGGFLGRRGDGPPGVRALWRGYQRLQDMLEGVHLYASTTADDPKGG